MNETIKTILNRNSLRRFSEKPVTEAEKDLIIQSAMRAPTAGNLMLYSIIKIENKDTLEILSHTCDEQPFIKSAKFALIFLVDYQKMYDYFAESNFLSYCLEQGKKPEYPELSDLLLGAQDAMAAAQNAVIAAQSLGIGSCYIGDIIENYEKHRDLFNLEDLAFPLSMLVFGHYPENTKLKPRSRFDKKYVVFDEKYRKLERNEIFDMYRDWESKYNPNNIYGAKNRAQMIYGRKIGSDFSIEMKRSIEVAFKAFIKKSQEKL